VVKVVVLPHIGGVVAGRIVQEGGPLEGRREAVFGADRVHPFHHFLLIGFITGGDTRHATAAGIGWQEHPSFHRNRRRQPAWWCVLGLCAFAWEHGEEQEQQNRCQIADPGS